MKEPESPVLVFERLIHESDARKAQREAAVAEPLDEWCEFCENKLATMKTADGVAACAECAKDVLAAMEKYSQEMAEAGEYPLAVFDKDGVTVLTVNLIREPHFGPNRADRRHAQRKLRLRNSGAMHVDDPRRKGVASHA